MILFILIGFWITSVIAFLDLGINEVSQAVIIPTLVVLLIGAIGYLNNET